MHLDTCIILLCKEETATSLRPWWKRHVSGSIQPFIPKFAFNPCTIRLFMTVIFSAHSLFDCVHLQMGSMSDNTSGGTYAYRASKAALNAGEGLAGNMTAHGANSQQLLLHSSSMMCEASSDMWLALQ
jgi:hypothetical protein